MKVPVCEPFLGEEEALAAKDAVSSGWISGYRGKYIDEFEEQFAKYCGCKYGISTTSCATALLLTLESLGIGKGDEVITTAFTHIATVSAILHAGAKPVLVDVEPDTWCMNPSLIEGAITSRTKAIMPVPMYGHPVDIHAIIRVIERHQLPIIEDAAEAIGAQYLGCPVGALSDAACFSFYINKMITTGEGGMIVTNSQNLADMARRLKGYDTDPESRFIHEKLGFNYRMCLPASTKVLVNKMKKWKNKTSSGESLKLISVPIEQISIGDEVLSFNEKTGKKETKKVTGTSNLIDNDLIRLVFSNGNELVLTSNHPIYVHDSGWVAAGDTCIGDTVLQYNYLALNWRLTSLDKRGRKLDDIHGKEQSVRIRTKHSKQMKKLRADPQSSYNTSSVFNTAAMHKKQGDSLRRLCQIKDLYPPERRARIGQHARSMWANPESKIRSKESIDRKGASISASIQKRMQSDPEFGARLRKWGTEAIKSVIRKPTKLEKELITLLQSCIPNTYRYVGDGKFWIENANPDFVNVNGYKKAIEIYTPYWKIRDYGSIANYQEQRRTLFLKYGWDVLFIEVDRKVKDPNKIINDIISFTYNPGITAITIASKENIPIAQTVYNLDVKDNNNFFAYGILVHNTNVQAAIGCAQMNRIDELVTKKTDIAGAYINGLGGLNWLQMPTERVRARNCYWVFGILVNPRAPTTRNALVARLKAADIETRNFFVPMNKQPALLSLGLFSGEEYPVAEDISERGLYLPNGTTLTKEQINYVCYCIAEIER